MGYVLCSIILMCCFLLTSQVIHRFSLREGKKCRIFIRTMTDRHRRREASWDKKQEMLSPAEIHSIVSWCSSPKWSKSEVNDGMMSLKFSGRHSREPLLEKRSGPLDDDFSRDRHRMQTDPGFDEWEKQYSTHPSIDSYGPPYRGHDRRKRGNALMGRDRVRDQDRPRSPYRSRSRSRGLARVVSRSRSRSRSRGRDWGGTKARSRSPFYDDRHETNEYVNARSRSRRLDHTGGSRYDDYRRDDRNQYDDRNHRRQSNRNSRIPCSIPCRYFAAGNCNRNDCKFSHDVPEPRRYDERSHDDIREHNSGNRNRTWHEQQPPDDLNVSDFSNNAKSSFGEKKPWNGPLWDDVEARGFNERPPKDIHDHTLHDKNRTSDEVDASGLPDVGKSNSNSDKKKSWNGPSWDELTGSGFSNASKPCHNPEDHKKSWNGVDESSLDIIHDHTSHDNNSIRNDIDASGFADVGKSNRISDNKKKSWNGPSWDEVTGSAFSNASKRSRSSEHHKKSWNRVDENSRNDIHDYTSRDKNRRDDVEPRGFNERSHKDIHERTSHDINRICDNVDASGFPDAGKSNLNPDNHKLRNGPPWDEVSRSGFSNALMPFHNSEDRKKPWNGVDESSCGDIPDCTSHGRNRIRDDVDASSFPDVGKCNRLSDNKRRLWNGPSWDKVTGSGLSNASKPSYNEDSKKSWIGAKSCHDIDGNMKKWNGPLWDEVGEPGHSEVGKSGWGNATSPVIVQTDNKIRKWDGPELNGKGFEKNENLLPQWTSVGIVVNDSNLSNVNIVSDDANQQVTYEKDSTQSVHDMNSQSLSYLDETKNPFNEPKVQLNEQVEGVNLHQQTQIQSKECGEPLKPMDIDVPQVMSDANEANLTSQLAPQVNSLPTSLPELSQIEGQVPHLNIIYAIDYIQSLPSSAYNQDTQHNSTTSMEVKTSVPMGILPGPVIQENKIVSHTSACKIGTAMEKEPVGNLEGTDNTAAENANQEQDNINPEKVEEGDIGNDEKAMRLFKVALAEFVKEILKPRWKEGKLSREVHKNVVKKVVNKVTETIQVNQIPRTQVKTEQYLAYSKPKITKLVEAYVERFLKVQPANA